MNVLYLGALLFLRAGALASSQPVARVHPDALPDDGGVCPVRLRQSAGAADVRAHRRLRRGTHCPRRACGSSSGCGAVRPGRPPRSPSRQRRDLDESRRVVRYTCVPPVATSESVREPVLMVTDVAPTAELHPPLPTVSSSTPRRGIVALLPTALAIVAGAGFSALTTWLAFARYDDFQTGRFDLEIYTQVVWNIAHGHGFADNAAQVESEPSRRARRAGAGANRGALPPLARSEAAAAAAAGWAGAARLAAVRGWRDAYSGRWPGAGRAGLLLPDAGAGRRRPGRFPRRADRGDAAGGRAWR